MITFRHLLVVLACTANAAFHGRAALGDEVLYEYDGTVLPYPNAGWLWGGCEGPCTESVENGHSCFAGSVALTMSTIPW